MKTEVGGKGRVVQNTHENKLADHGMPPTEDLAEKLWLHLWRADLHDDRPGTKKVTYYDLRATGITWEALAKTEFLSIIQRAGHRESRQRSTTSRRPKPLASMRASRSQRCRSA